MHGSSLIDQSVQVSCICDLSHCFQSLRLVCSSSHELLILGISVRIILMQWFPFAICMIVFRHTVGLLWTSDQPVSETSTCTGHRNTRDKHPCPQRDSNPRPQQPSSVAQEPEDSSPHSQQPATGPCPETVESNPHPPSQSP
jgi:cell division septation protein DedD